MNFRLPLVLQTPGYLATSWHTQAMKIITGKYRYVAMKIADINIVTDYVVSNWQYIRLKLDMNENMEMSFRSQDDTNFAEDNDVNTTSTGNIPQNEIYSLKYDESTMANTIIVSKLPSVEYTTEHYEFEIITRNEH